MMKKTPCNLTDLLGRRYGKNTESPLQYSHRALYHTVSRYDSVMVGELLTENLAGSQVLL